MFSRFLLNNIQIMYIEKFAILKVHDLQEILIMEVFRFKSYRLLDTC